MRVVVILSKFVSYISAKVVSVHSRSIRERNAPLTVLVGKVRVDAMVLTGLAKEVCPVKIIDVLKGLVEMAVIRKSTVRSGHIAQISNAYMVPMQGTLWKQNAINIHIVLVFLLVPDKAEDQVV